MTKYHNTWSFLFILNIALIILNILFGFKIDNFNQRINLLNDIEYINSATQRILKQTINNNYTNLSNSNYNIENEQLVKDISALVHLIDITDDVHLIIRDIYDSEVILNEFIKDWYDIEKLLLDDNLKTQELYFSGERHFYNSNELIFNLQDNIFHTLNVLIFFAFVNFSSLILIIFINIKNFRHLKIEIEKNEEISTSMFVDSATGLYDRSRCQELFKEEQPQIEEKSRIVIIFDLNDLKKTNDTYGHKIGDELIETFAKILKDGTKIHKKEPFLGRYGGDEFVIYYDNEDKQEVNLYLQEIEKVRLEQNKKEKRYQISYAVGYAIADKSTGIKTFRELFDEADNNMYKNKKKMKEFKEFKELKKKNKPN